MMSAIFFLREKGSSASVIIHVISRDRELIRPFQDHGFTPGMRPQQPLPHPGMETFFPLFMRIMQTGEATAASP